MKILFSIIVPRSKSRRNACSDFDELVLVCRIVLKTFCFGKVQDGLTEERHVDLGGDLDEDVCLPLRGVDQVADGEGNVGRVVFFVLLKDHVAPGLVEISAGHFGAVESPEDRNQLGIYVSFPFAPFVSAQAVFPAFRLLCPLKSSLVSLSRR